MDISNKFNKIASFLYKMIFYLTSAILSELILSSLVFTVYMPLSAKERVEFSYSAWYFPILIMLFILLFFKSKQLIEKISSEKLFLILSIVYFVLGLFLIIRIVGGLRADASIVFNTAVDFNNGNFSSLTKEGAYLYVYPHQLGLTTFDRIYAFFFQFFKNERIIYFFNLLFILGTNFFIYRISLKLFKNKLVTNYTIILSFLFFPHFFFQLFAYGTIPGLFFVLLGYYHLLKYNETSHYSNAILSILSFILACLIRNNYVIFVITITLVQVFSFLENVNWRKLIVTFLIVISIPASSFLLKSYYQSVTHVPISQGLPMLAYVTMGTQDSPVAPSIGGWWDGYNTWLLKNNDFDRPKAVEQAKNDLKKNMLTFYNQPMYAVEFFYKKILSTWLEPTFQSIWTGPLPDLGNVQNSRILKSIYEEKNGYYFLNSFGKVLTVSIYLLTLISVVYNIKSKNFSAFELFTIIFFLGGFFFHVFWETKSQYVYIYVLLLIPSAAKGLEKLESIPILKRLANESHNQISKVHSLITDVITRQSIKLIRFITSLGIITSLISFLMIIWILWGNLVGTDVAGWVSTYAIVSLFGGIQLISLGVIGEYIGKIYLENKHGSRSITSDCTYDESDE